MYKPLVERCGQNLWTSLGTKRCGFRGYVTSTNWISCWGMQCRGVLNAVSERSDRLDINARRLLNSLLQVPPFQCKVCVKMTLYPTQSSSFVKLAAAAPLALYLCPKNAARPKRPPPKPNRARTKFIHRHACSSSMTCGAFLSDATASVL